MTTTTSDIDAAPAILTPIESASSSLTIRDAIALTKPRITMMNAILGAAILVMEWAQGRSALTMSGAVLVVVGIALAVAGAGALNMALEHHLDAKMARTKDRPIASGRVSPAVGFAVGFVLVGLSCTVMFFAGSLLASSLTLLAAILYAGVYTPMKRRSSWAVVVGAVPGALPILMASTAATGAIEPMPVILFLVLFIWQLPHFAAISVYRASEYRAAGYVVFPSSHGNAFVWQFIVVTGFALVGVSMAPVVIGTVGFMYGFTTFVVGVWFLSLCAAGARCEFSGNDDGVSVNRWARRVFIGTLVHQLVMFAALALDVTVRSLGA